jgi:serine/threonine-protein phosphatase PGAM5
VNVTRRLLFATLIAGINTVGAQPTPAVAAPPRAEPNPAFTRTIYLVRHGAYDTHTEHPTDDGPGLTSLGIAQARLVAARLRGLPVIFNSLTTSTMTRAQDTARVIHEMLPDLPIRSTPNLRECTPQTLNSRFRHEGTPAEDAACEGTLDQAFTTYFTPGTGSDQNDVIVCHGNVIRYFVMKALGVDTKAWLGMSVAHASLTIIRVTPRGRFIVLTVGDVGHIPPNMQSGTTPADPELVVPSAG